MVAMSDSVTKNSNHSADAFLSLLPQIQAQARVAFRHEDAEFKDELMSEVIANAFCAYQRLLQLGKQDLAFATPLALYAIKHARVGRRVGSKMNSKDVMSEYARYKRKIRVQCLSEFHQRLDGIDELLIEDRQAGPAETAAARIDIAAWLHTLNRTKRKLAKLLARGELTSVVAKLLNLTAGRVSQLRRELYDSWLAFQGSLATA